MERARLSTSACDWYIFQIDDDTKNAFGYANLNDPQDAEGGYVSLPELEAVRVGPWVVERDLRGTPEAWRGRHGCRLLSRPEPPTTQL